MASYSYTPPSAQALDPYNIETSLAQGASDTRTSGVALPLLLGYMAERQQSTKGYNDRLNNINEMQAQSNYASQANDQRKAIIDALTLAKNPGMAQAIASNPTLAPMLQGTDLNPAAQAAAEAHSADTFSKFGSGAQGFTNAGVSPDIPSLNARTGMSMLPGLPPIVQAAQINAAGRLAAANASGGNSTKFLPSMNYEPISGSFTLSGKLPPGSDPAKVAQQWTSNPNTPFKTRNPDLKPGANPDATAAPFNANVQLLQLKQNNPVAYQDVQRKAYQNGGQLMVDGDKLVGATGQRY